jgi:signal peptide peptidase SppA, 67K type
MKQFFKTMFASTFGALIAMIIMSVLTISLIIGLIASASLETAYTPSTNTVFKLTLKGSISDNVTENPIAEFFGEKKNLSLSKILKAIRIAKNNNNIKGIYIEASGVSASPATMEEIRRALQDFKTSGKFLIAYGDYYGRGEYFLCSVADSIFVNPIGLVDLSGFASFGMFYTNLAKKIGVEPYIFKVGTYKGAVEPYFLKKFSDENREQISSYLGSVWNNVLLAISESRNISVDSLNYFADNGFTLAKTDLLLEYNLVDGLYYKREVEDMVKVIAGQSGNKLEVAGVNKISRVEEREQVKENKITILYAEGTIMESSSNPLFSGSEPVIDEKVGTELRKLRDDYEVKAVVFRVNSPGGSAYISEQVWKAVEDVKAVKPIVVSMGGYAASGGYYISCGANKIVAEKTTLTGSIGVFGVFPNMTGLFDKIGITTDVVKTNKYSDLGDTSRPMRDDEKAFIQKSVERTYDLFITRCAEGRGMSKEQIDAIGQGRVWTGEQALERGLVDRLGGIDVAVEEAAALAQVTDYSVNVANADKDFLQEYIEKQMEEIKMGFVENVLGDDFEVFKAIKRAKSEAGIQARMPYEVLNF